MIVRRIFLVTTAVVTVAGIVTACSSVPDVTFGTGTEEDGGGTSLPDGSGGFDTGGPKEDAGADAAKDAPGDAIACAPTNGGIEDCTDGLDNDCDGKTDCADDACQPTHACISTPVPGWSLVSEADDARPPCPADFPTAKDIEVVSGTGAGTCACSCTPTVPAEACNVQPMGVRISGKATCSEVGDVTEQVKAAQTACAALTSPIDVPNGQAFGESTAPVVPPSGCTAATSIANAPPITSGRTCAPTATPAFGGGCGVGMVCARKPAAGLALCLQKAGASNACPVTYPTRKTAGAADVDGSVPDGGTTADNRTCNACTCNQPPCTSTVTLFKNGDCSGSTTGALGATCAGTTDKNFTALAYKSTTAGTGCGVGAFDTATAGTIDFTDPSTICCP